MRRICLTALATAALGALFTAAPAAADANGQVRLVYVSPDGPNVDFYVDGQPALTTTAYKTVSRYLPVPAARHTFEVRQAGAAAGAATMAQVASQVDASGYYTVTVGGKSGKLSAVVFQDGFSAPASGQASARFIHTAPEVPGVDVALKGGKVLFTNISFLQASNYSAFPAGTYDLELRATGTDQVLFSASGVGVTAGTIRSLTAIGGVGQPIELLQLADAATSGAVPAGGADTGAGGLATERLTLLGLLVSLPALMVTAIATRRGRRFRTS